MAKGHAKGKPRQPRRADSGDAIGHEPTAATDAEHAGHPTVDAATTAVTTEAAGTVDSHLKTKETVMQEAAKAQEVLNQATGKGLETLTLWAEANQRVLREMVELGAGAAKEGIRLYAELQQGAIDAFREGQAAAIRWQSSWQEGPKDPVQWYQKAMTETVDGTQKWFQFVEGNSQAVTRSAERLQASAEQAGKGIQQTFAEFVSKTKEIYARN